MAKTRAKMNELIIANLSSSPADKITALEHNEVARESVEYITGQVVAGGSVPIGNILGGDNNFGPISLGVTLPDTNYGIVGHLTSLIVGGGNQWDYDNDGVWQLAAKTTTSFTIRLGEWAGVGQNLNFDWLAIIDQV